jgi:hypothetical protein
MAFKLLSLAYGLTFVYHVFTLKRWVLRKAPYQFNNLLRSPDRHHALPTQALQKLQDYTFLPTACSEAGKLGANLSSLCLLVNRKHTYF